MLTIYWLLLYLVIHWKYGVNYTYLVYVCWKKVSQMIGYKNTVKLYNSLASSSTATYTVYLEVLSSVAWVRGKQFIYNQKFWGCIFRRAIKLDP